MSIRLQLRRGLETNLPTLAAGEPGFCADSYKLFIGSAAGNQGIAMLANPMFAGLLTPSLVMQPQVIALINESTNPVLPSGAGETSRIMDGTQCDIWYAAGVGFETLYYSYATDSSCKTFAAPTLCLTDIRFPCVIKEGATYYLFAQKPSSGAGIFMWNSSDKVTWTIMNGGVPVFTISADPTSIYYHMWNPGVVVIAGVWHFFIECGTQADESDVGLGYSYSTLAELNWDIHRTTIHIIKNGVNANPIYVPNKNSILLLHGMFHNSQANIADITASYADISNNFSLLSTWKKAPFFCIHYDDMHTADPDFVVAGTGKDHNIIIGFLYNQSTSYQVYSNFSLDEFFDAVTIYDEANFTNRNFLNLYCLKESGNPGIYSAGFSADIDLFLGAKGAGVVRVGKLEIGVNAVAATIVTGLKLTQGNPGGARIGTAIELSTGVWLTSNPKIAGYWDGAGQALGFFTSDGTLYERMTILGSGKVGINNVAPNSQFAVVGLPSYATDALAGTGGLTTGDFYTITGSSPLQLAVKI